MAGEIEPTNKIPTDADRLNYLKYLVDSGRYSEFPDQIHAPVSENDGLVEKLFRANLLDIPAITDVSQYQEVPRIVSTITETIPNIGKIQFCEKQKQEQQENLRRIQNLRQSIINKLKNDERATRPNPSAYQREKRINGGTLCLSYSISSPDQDNLEITFDKKRSLIPKKEIKRVHDFITTNNKGEFRNIIVNIQPDNTAHTLYYELSEINSKEHPATPEVILEVEKIMNSYLQPDKNIFETLKSKLETIKRFLPPIFHHKANPKN